MKIAVELAYYLAFQAKTAHYQERTRRWWAEQTAAARALSSPQERRDALADLYADREYRREHGLWWDGQRPIFLFYLREHLQARGWLDRRWPPVPHGQQRLPGRRWGVPNNPARNWTARLQVSLPAELETVLQRATHHVSRRATRRLQDWLGQHPYPHSRGELVELDQLRAEIVTTGDVMRQVLIDATADWFPTVG